MHKHWYYLALLAWISYLLSSSLFLFMDGFFLNRDARTETADCTLCAATEDCRLERLLEDIESSERTCLPPRARVVLLVVDALKYEFLDWHEGVDADSTHHLNKIPAVRNLLRAEPDKTRLLKFVADPPTTTMQRLKALTTGTLPTFIDARANFAAESVGEDNLIDQAGRRGGVVFMGDDTWTKLFPGKFLRQFPSPSFDTRDLDTVDRQVRHRLSFEMEKTDWRLLVAHSLGVDHCGHRYGPRHPEMARKLADVNSLIEEIVASLDNETALFVVGDHGMTDSGDHGGDSDNELQAGMFVFSKTPLLGALADYRNGSISQIDLVPTLAAIMGVPIPFSSIGTIVPECLPRRADGDRKKTDLGFVTHSVWRNVAQTRRYIRAYTNDSFLFTERQLERIERLWDIAEKDAKRVDDDESLARFYRSSSAYLKTVRDLCSEIWIQFDPSLMSKGLIIFFSVLFLVCILLSAVEETKMSQIMRTNFLSFVVVANIFTSCLICILHGLRIVEDLKHTMFFATGAISVLLLAILAVQNWDYISTRWYRGAALTKLHYFERGVFLLSFCGVFSNSFIVEEDKVMLFLLVTTIALLVYKIIDAGDYSVPSNCTRKWKSEKSLRSSGYSRFILIVVGFIACLAVRFSSYFWRCREEQNQDACNLSMGKAGFPKNMGTERALLIASVTILAVYVTAVTNWLRNCERISEFVPTTNIARYCYGVIAVTIGCYWAFERLPRDARLKLAIVRQVNALPIIVYFFVAFGIIALYYRPLGVCLMRGKEESAKSPKNEYTARSLLDKVADVLISRISSDESEHPVVRAPSIFYSSAFISLSGLLTLLCFIVLDYFFAIGMFAMFVTCIAVLGIVAMERFSSTNVIAELLHVPISAILCWFLIAEYFFYGTGHQATFPTIHWDAAFIGTGGDFYGNFLPMILIGLNTFGCHLIIAMTLPLLIIVPFTLYVMFPTIVHPKFNVDGDMRKGEFILFERDATFHHELFSMYGKYILLHAVRTFGCMLTTTIHCRHLMAWKIFAPKLIFQGLSFLVTLGSVLASAFMIQRIDRQLNILQLRSATMKTR